MSEESIKDRFSAPGAWGRSRLKTLKQQVKNLMETVVKRRKLLPPMQILFDITVAR